MIYTLTLNPSIDYTVRLDSLKTGITNRTLSEEYCFGGKGINVSCVLAELGVKSTALGFVAGFTGEAIEKGIKNPKITTDFITLADGISRINVKIKAEKETEINGRGPNVSEKELLNLFDKTDNIRSGDVLVLAGSIPGTMPDDTYERIIKRLDGKNVLLAVDATKNLLLNCLKYKPFLIKPNRQELSEIFGAEINDDNGVVKYANELRRLGARNVLVSLGGDGALLADEFGDIHKSGVASGTALNTVGSGDSMVAGFIAGFTEKQDYKYALRLASACGNATAFSNGLATKEKIDELLEKF